MEQSIQTSAVLKDVRYEIRGQLASHALELEKRGYEIICSNVPSQWAVQTALGGFQSIVDLVSPGGRLYQSRQAIIDRVAASEFLSLQKPMGAMYAFVRLDPQFQGKLDDQEFALELLEKHHVLVAPGTSFNTPYSDHFRITTLPDPETINTVFDRIDTCLAAHA
jgi:alanine-synthesizing transaminase